MDLSCRIAIYPNFGIGHHPVEKHHEMLPGAEIIPISAMAKFNVNVVMKRIKEPHFGRKKAGDLFQISCSVCRCEGGGYLAVKVRDKLTRWVDGTLKNYGSLVISSLA